MPPESSETRFDWSGLWPWGLGFAVVAYLGLEGGGFDPLVGDQVGIAAWWVLLLAVAVGALPRLPLSRTAWLAVGLLLGSMAGYLKRQEHPERALVVVASSWNAVGGALVIALAGEPDAAWSVWPVLLAAVLAQFVFDFLGSAARAWFAFGIAPHQYLTSRRVDRARRLLLDGRPPGEVAALTGFHDQSHLTRHFRRLVGVTPGRYARP